MESFSARVKRELCRVPPREGCCAAAECYGALLLGNTFSVTELKIVTAHESYARRLPPLFKAAFGYEPSLRSSGEGRTFILSVTEPALVHKTREAFGYGAEATLALHLNYAALERECCQQAFWRGAFLSGGAVTDPQKHFRVELSTPHRHLARELPALMRESGLEPRHTERAGLQVLYLKQSEAAIDFLTLCGASLSAMTVMQHKMEKELRNNINRRVNCDSHNLDRTVAAVERQRAVILRLSEQGRLDALPETLRQTARVRLDYPEDSIAQLAERLSVSKSCLNHRLRKLAELDRQYGSADEHSHPKASTKEQHNGGA